MICGISIERPTAYSGGNTVTEGPSCAARVPIQRAITVDIDDARRTDTVAWGSATEVIDVAGQLLGGE
ncbi:hypothetical protein MHAE_08278 [Mycobacterium haemophilum DSM 44634]|uniref:Uncharacterized protein n=1 Tax=Mycobacterium haemophilum TaxID=29311 RepID=A0A0I9UGT2_9MYCO|nr:hypothetical protein B586_02720 [Mycobacterium haemophilum DSM 44634]KLO28611.1 hypothetical protein ABH39_13530 [Mycobacterium haemophilum]KLO35540.1 hypothetical protein ABH38_15775 [Mycobacterium haemophilum]KLO40775.1 hypothetical protein ABH37_15505 [Mycobacterium haemophilum]KLO48111.1 hypothetical protein ABH36_14475 [Mycobacterium haemophilum]